jgi:hypothetical protein
MKPVFNRLVELPKDDSNGPDIPGKLKLLITRQPYDDSYSILLPNGSEEYVPTDKAERILFMYGVKDPEKILTHVWNFYSALVYVKDPATDAAGKSGTGNPPSGLPGVGVAHPIVQTRDGDLRHY